MEAKESTVSHNIRDRFIEMQSPPFSVMTNDQILDILDSVANYNLFEAEQAVAVKQRTLAAIKANLAHARRDEQRVLESCPRRNEHYGEYDAFAAVLIGDDDCADAMGTVDMLAVHEEWAVSDLEIAEKNLRIAVKEHDDINIELSTLRKEVALSTTIHQLASRYTTYLHENKLKHSTENMNSWLLSMCPAQFHHDVRNEILARRS